MESAVKQKKLRRKERLSQIKSDIKQEGFFVNMENDTKIYLLESIVPNARANILIVSPFGKTVHDLFLLTYYLNYNGFNVFRFDPRDHVGISTGDMVDFSLHKLEIDVNEAIKYFHFDDELPTVILSMSLSFPVALKHATVNNKIASVISIVGVVDPDDTSIKAAKVIPNDYRKPLELITAKTYSEPFGCRLYCKTFVDGLDSGGYAWYEDVLSYLKLLKVPIFMIAAEQDEYVKIEDVHRFFGNKEVDGQLIVLEGVTHEIGRSVSAAKLVAKQVVSYAQEILEEQREVIMPSLVEVIAQSEKESEYINTFN